MATSDTEHHSSLFWLVTGYILTITLLVVIGAGLYYFTGAALGAPAITFNQLAFWAFMTWLALVWFCPIFILSWRKLAELNARYPTGKDAAPVKSAVPVMGQADIAAHLRHRYGRRWKRNVRVLMVLGEVAEVEQAVPGLTEQQWLEGENTLLLWGGSAQAEPDMARISAWRKLRRRPLDGIVWAVDPTQTILRETLDTVARQLQKQYEVMKWKAPVWLWEIHQSPWEQKGRETQTVGCEFASKSTGDAIQVSLNSLIEPLTARGMQQVVLNRQHSFLVSLAQHLRQGGVMRLNQIADTLRTGAAALPLAGIMFSPPLMPAAVLPRHGWLPDPAWYGITRYAGQLRPLRVGVEWIKTAQWCTGIALLLWAAGSLLSFTVNRHQMLEDHERVATAAAPHQSMEERLLSQSALQREISRLQYRALNGAPWYSRFGLSQNDALLNSLWASYTRINTPLIRDAVVQHLQQQLSVFQALPADSPLRGARAKETYSLLKAYLMMTKPEKMDAEFFTQTLMKSWPQRDGVKPGLWQGTAPDLLTFYAKNLPVHPDGRIKPDMKQVNDVRNSLLRQIGVNNAETTLYENILTQVRHNYTDLTLEDMTSGTDADRLFTTKESVPGMFTRRAWENEVKDAIDQAASARREEIDWVLSDSRKPVTGDVSPEALKARLTQRYFTDFAGSWLGFLNSLRWVPARNIADVTDQLTLMSDVRQSPLIALMNTLSIQGQTGQQGAGLSDTLMNSAKKLIKRDDTPAIDQSAGPTGPLQETFGPLLALTGKNNVDGAVSTSGTLTLAEYLTQVTRVRLHLQQVATAPDPQAMMQILAQTVFQGKSVDLTDTQQYGTLMAAGLGEEWHSFGQTVFVRPLTQAWESVLRPSAAGLNDQWRRSVVTGWNAAFDGRYPFVAAGSDASLPELAEYIRQGSGRIDTFLTNQLAGVLHKEGNRWVQDKSSSQGLAVNPAFLKAVNQLSELSALLFADGGQGLSFDLQARPAPRVVDTSLTVDGQVLHYFNQLPEWQAFHWPGDTYRPGTLLTWSTTTTGSRLYGDYGGTWGLIRWLDQSQRQQLDPHRWMLSMKAPDGNTLQWVLRPQLGSGPLALLSLRGFTLPEQIFRVGNTAVPMDNDDDESDGMVP